MKTDSFNIYIDGLNNLMKSIEITDNNHQIISDTNALKTINSYFSHVKCNVKKIMIVGNGGSASIASHMQNDICKSAGIRAMVFTEQPLLTAYSNDISYAAAYEQLVSLWADEGDLLIAISSSGKSENILRAVQAAKSKGCNIITLSGFRPDNPLKNLGHVNYYLNVEDYGYVELGHSIIAHYISDQMIIC